MLISISVFYEIFTDSKFHLTSLLDTNKIGLEMKVLILYNQIKLLVKWAVENRVSSHR